MRFMTATSMRMSPDDPYLAGGSSAPPVEISKQGEVDVDDLLSELKDRESRIRYLEIEIEALRHREFYFELSRISTKAALDRLCRDRNLPNSVAALSNYIKHLESKHK